MYDDYNGLPRNPMGFVLVSLVCGIIGTAVVFLLSDYSLLSAILGATGMVIGGFSISLAHHFPTKERMQYMGFAAAGIMMSVISFMFGFVYFLT